MTHHLIAALAEAVPLQIEELRGLTDRQLQGRADWLRTLNLVGAKGDVLQYGGGRTGEVATVFARLVETLAVLAYAEGGVTAFGLHWCAAPCDAYCPAGAT